MTALGVASIGIFLLSHVVVFTAGLIIGGWLMAVYISQQMTKAQRELERKFSELTPIPPILPIPPTKGEEWKQRDKPTSKDESWLRRMLGDDKEKK